MASSVFEIIGHDLNDNLKELLDVTVAASKRPPAPVKSPDVKVNVEPPNVTVTSPPAPNVSVNIPEAWREIEMEVVKRDSNGDIQKVRLKKLA